MPVTSVVPQGFGHPGPILFVIYKLVNLWTTRKSAMGVILEGDRQSLQEDLSKISDRLVNFERPFNINKWHYL